MSEDRIWRVAQSVGFDDYELKPMLEAFAAALSKPAPSPQPADSDDQDAKWRDVALRFDKHRMSTLWHLQALLKDPARHAEVVRKFLSDPTHPNVQPAGPVVSAEQIEDLAWLDVDEHGEIDRSSDHNKMMTAPQRCAFKRGARAILDLRPAGTLTGCNCRWDGETQIEWCELHLAHKDAIHDWAERAKSAEQKLAMRPAVEPMTPEDVDAKCLTIIGHLLSRRERDRIVWRMAEAHHFGITAKAEGGA